MLEKTKSILKAIFVVVGKAAFNPLYQHSIFLLIYIYSQKQTLEVFYKKGVPKNLVRFLGKHLCWSLNSIKKETPTQVFSREFLNL